MYFFVNFFSCTALGEAHPVSLICSHGFDLQLSTINCILHDHSPEGQPHLIIKFWMAWRWLVSSISHWRQTRINSLGAPIGSVWKNNLIGRKRCSARMQWTANFILDKVNVLSILFVHHWKAKCQYQVLLKQAKNPITVRRLHRSSDWPIVALWAAWPRAGVLTRACLTTRVYRLAVNKKI